MIKRRLSKAAYLSHFPVETKPPSIIERRDKWNKFAKKYLKAKGLIGPKLPSSWIWSYNDAVVGRIEAFTRSQARAQIKKILDVKTLPKDVKLEKENDR